MMTDISLETGQTARLEGGIMRVQPNVPRGTPHHYRLTARHTGGGLLDVRCADLDATMAFLRQLEPLGYAMCSLSRVEG